MDTADGGFADPQSFANFIVTLAGDQHSGNNNSPPQHHPLARGQQIPQKQFDGFATPHRAGGRVESIESGDKFFLGQILRATFHIVYTNISGPIYERQ